MFNPYYYKKVDLAGEAQLKQRQDRLHQSLTADLAERSRARQGLGTVDGKLDPSLDPMPPTPQPGTGSSASSKPSSPSTRARSPAPRKHPRDHCFRDRDPSRDISPEKFESRKWKYAPAKERADKAAALNRSEAMHVNQPRYQSPGLNLRHANFHVNPMCYGLRERDRSQDVAAEPWRSGTSGWRTERDRIDKFLDDYAPNSLGESLPARLPTSVRDNMKESTKGPGPDFRRHFNKKDRGYFVNELPTGDFNHEDYREKAHPDTAKGQPFREREINKEIKQKDAIKTRVGFTGNVKNGQFFNKPNYDPLD
uniref:Uncharacterized protein n=1 Tax=Eutreptiella gymnastica TaxID=73025 RepID=A0A7S4CZ29_9EUGL|mmetsp:Transcript_87725/g.145847  ORF Transcript_87725/g.145847 Transcript_87725/m.145847 type:complete len:310 (-) Transcript_87725:186-1115(-)